MEREWFEGASVPVDVGFEQDELRERLRQLQDGMRGRDLDMVLLFDQVDILYITGARDLAGSLPMALVVPVDGAYTLVTRAVDDLAFRPQAMPCFIVAYDDEESPAEAMALAVRGYQGLSGPVAVPYASRALTVRLFEEVRTLLDDRTWVDATDVLWAIEARKSPAELAQMRAVADINTAGLADAVRSMAPGVHDHEVAAALMGGLLSAGSHMTAGYYQVVSGVRTATAHATHDGSVLDADDHILFEFSASRYRYVSPLMRTAVVGEPSADLRAMHDAAQLALEAAIDAMKAGATSGSVHAAADSVLDRFGMRDLRPHRTGYMVGTAPASTGWPQGYIMNLRAGDPGVLEEGMTFHLPLALYRPGIAAVGISETVVVTAAGGEALGEAPRGLLRAEDFA